ncbi:MAG: cation:proton antiporter [Synechococcales cyanobacterium RM1_1_8]|nr:cation:proton antiporter [Synechococcales cyanobacterium RM1_1_8]
MTLETMTLIWIALPFLIGFSIYLLPQLARILALAMALVSMGYGLASLSSSSMMTLQLLDSFGVTLQVDALGGYFVLTNAVVTAAVLLYCWSSQKGGFFYAQLMVLHGSVNAVFICADFISLYVALEVIAVASFLLMTYARSDRAIWVGLRYLFVSNTAMLFYLMGAVLLYRASGSFAFSSLAEATPEALALLCLGLLTKGGVFVSGLWLPLTHSEAETPVSAMLSGVVVKTGVFPLLRCGLMFPELQPPLAGLGMATALLGVGYALVERDTKRMLALSTISQMGFLLVAPVAAGFYALTHGLAKASLFLLAGNLPSRDLRRLREQPGVARSLWGGMAIAALSVAGCPLLAGYGAKTLTMAQLGGPSWWLMTLAAVGTTLVCAKLIFLPILPISSMGPGAPPDGERQEPLKLGLKAALGVTLGGLVLANGFSLELYNPDDLIKALMVLGVGGLLYGLGGCRVLVKLPRGPEQFENLIGAMGIVVVLLFSVFLSLPNGWGV